MKPLLRGDSYPPRDKPYIRALMSSNYPSSQPQGMDFDLPSIKTAPDRFKTELPTYLKEINDNITKLTDEKPQIDITKLLITTFIGRTNPPHEGHIMAILAVILEALKQNGCALILLGSGPGKMTNAKNPIPFELKRLFIISKLTEKLITLQKQGEPCLQGINIPDLFLNGKINIQEMGKQVEQQRDAFSSELDRLNVSEISLQNILFVGDKEGDATKLDFFRIGVARGLDRNGRNIPIEASILPLTPIETTTGEAMSATIVRDFVKINSLENFRSAFRSFYNIEPPVSFLTRFLPEIMSYEHYIKDEKLDFANLFFDIIKSEFEKEATSKLVAEKLVAKNLPKKVTTKLVAEKLVAKKLVDEYGAAPKETLKKRNRVVESDTTTINVKINELPTQTAKLTKVVKKKNAKNAGGSRKKRKTKRRKSRKTKRRRLTKRKRHH